MMLRRTRFISPTRVLYIEVMSTVNITDQMVWTEVFALVLLDQIQESRHPASGSAVVRHAQRLNHCQC